MVILFDLHGGGSECVLNVLFFVFKDRPQPNDSKKLDTTFFKPSTRLNQDGFPTSFNVSFDHDNQPYNIHFAIDSTAYIPDVYAIGHSGKPAKPMHVSVLNFWSSVPFQQATEPFSYRRFKNNTHAHYFDSHGSSATLIKKGSDFRLVSFFDLTHSLTGNLTEHSVYRLLL
jgi:hypothetical protein